MIKYSFVPGWQPPIDPQVAGETLQEIAKRDGLIKPQTVVDESRPRKAPLHSYFEWNDATAAEQYRLDQASKLIRCVRVVSEAPGETELTLHRPYIHIDSVAESGYYPTAVVMSNVQLRQQAIAEAVAFLVRAKEKLKEYRELEREYAAIEAVEQRLLLSKAAKPNRALPKRVAVASA